MALGPATERILEMFEAIKEYFLIVDKCPAKIKAFFVDPLAKVWLMFVCNQAKVFQQTVLEIGSDNVAAVEVSSALDDLCEKNGKSKSIIFTRNVQNDGN